MTTADPSAVRGALTALVAAAAARLDDIRDARLINDTNPVVVQEYLARNYAFAAPMETEALIGDVLAMLQRWDLDSTHPRYFGLFNPPALPVTAAADALVAMLNPQVGTRTHAPAANAIEDHVLRLFLRRLGFPTESGGHFTSGGQEANTTAVAIALTRRYPDVLEAGLRGLPGTPRLYVSDHAHHSFIKAARFLGLGADAVRHVESNCNGRMQPNALADMVAVDRNAGDLPFLIVATAGTTGIGAIDPIAELADYAHTEALWLHTDAAWGGGALMSDQLRLHLNGIEHSDSVTWDAHKWLDVPMGAGMLLLREFAASEPVFHTDTGYVPPSEQGAPEPYQHTFQWSRRFIGLKVFMALASVSAPGYARLVEGQAARAEQLRYKLRERGWRITNDTPLPLVCFTDARLEKQGTEAVDALVSRVQARGVAWISSVSTPHDGTMVRACITSYDTQEADLDLLIEELDACLDDAVPGA
jgi:aromatic-L-amino-acid decarboxylase